MNWKLEALKHLRAGHLLVRVRTFPLGDACHKYLIAKPDMWLDYDDPEQWLDESQFTELLEEGGIRPIFQIGFVYELTPEGKKQLNNIILEEAKRQKECEETEEAPPS